jgi:hypothetical protein
MTSPTTHKQLAFTNWLTKVLKRRFGRTLVTQENGCGLFSTAPQKVGGILVHMDTHCSVCSGSLQRCALISKIATRVES